MVAYHMRMLRPTSLINQLKPFVLTKSVLGQHWDWLNEEEVLLGFLIRFQSIITRIISVPKFSQHPGWWLEMGQGELMVFRSPWSAIPLAQPTPKVGPGVQHWPHFSCPEESWGFNLLSLRLTSLIKLLPYLCWQGVALTVLCMGYHLMGRYIRLDFLSTGDSGSFVQPAQIANGTD